MTLTVKLHAALHERLRQRAAADSHSASELVRLALMGYLDAAEHRAKPSAMDLGRGLFPELPKPGAVAPPKLANLATQRKAELLAIWGAKASARQTHGVPRTLVDPEAPSGKATSAAPKKPKTRKTPLSKAAADR